MSIPRGEKALLGKIFAAECTCRLPWQGRSKYLSRLIEQGLIVATETTLGGRFPVTIKGFELTQLGRLTYCAECSKEAL
jgi:hypothetical protein